VSAITRIAGHPVALAVLRVTLGAVFLVACLDKIADPAAFARSIANYRLVPDRYLHVMATTLPWIEAVAGAALVAGLWTRAAALVTAGMLAVFIAAIGSAMARHLDISCGCFDSGPDARRMGLSTLLWDIVWLVQAAWLVAGGGGALALDGRWPRAANPPPRSPS
jgi:uncharacterized membrane protein YphA (DoxX/SURF4 family)